jgi:hypothetical protein
VLTAPKSGSFTPIGRVQEADGLPHLAGWSGKRTARYDVGAKIGQAEANLPHSDQIRMSPDIAPARREIILC